MTIERFWNLNYFYTYTLLIKLGDNLFQKPIFFLFPVIFKSKSPKAKAAYHNILNSENGGMRSIFAYNAMFLTTIILFSTIAFYIAVIFGFNYEDKIIYVLFIVLLSAYFTNYSLLGRKSVQTKYFKEFSKHESSKGYVIAIFFHLVIFTTFILSLYFFGNVSI